MPFRSTEKEALCSLPLSMAPLFFRPETGSESGVRSLLCVSNEVHTSLARPHPIQQILSLPHIHTWTHCSLWNIVSHENWKKHKLLIFIFSLANLSSAQSRQNSPAKKVGEIFPLSDYLFFLTLCKQAPLPPPYWKAVRECVFLPYLFPARFSC